MNDTELKAFLIGASQPVVPVCNQSKKREKLKMLFHVLSEFLLLTSVLRNESSTPGDLNADNLEVWEKEGDSRLKKDLHILPETSVKFPVCCDLESEAFQCGAEGINVKRNSNSILSHTSASDYANRCFSLLGKYLYFISIPCDCSHFSSDLERTCSSANREINSSLLTPTRKYQIHPDF